MPIPFRVTKRLFTATVFLTAMVAIFLAYGNLAGGTPAYGQSLPEVSLDNINIPTDEPVDGNVHVQEVVLVLDQPSTSEVSVRFTTGDVTAVAGEDYIAVDEVITFAPGTTQATTAVTIIETIRDGLVVVENSQRLSLTLSDPVGATLGQRKTGQITIGDDNRANLTMLTPDYVMEGEDIEVSLILDAHVEFNFTVILFSNQGYVTGNPVTRLATADSDYPQFQETVLMDKGLLYKHVYTIPTFQDNEIEGHELASVYLIRNMLTHDIVTDEFTNGVVIVDDDVPPGIQATKSFSDHNSLHKKSLFVGEGDTRIYDVWLSREPEQDVTVDVEVSGDPDLGPGIQTLTFTPLKWLEKQTVHLDAGSDSDSVNGRAEITHRITTSDPLYSGSKEPVIYLSERDNDIDNQGRKTFTSNVNSSGITVGTSKAPYRHNGDPYWMEIVFSEPISNGYKSLKNILNQGEHFGYVRSLHRVDGSSSRWALLMHPTDNMFTSLVIKPGDSCADSICSTSGEMLRNKLVFSLAPESKSPAEHPPGETNIPMVAFERRSSSVESANDPGDHQIVLTIDPAPTGNISFGYATFDLPRDHNPDNLDVAQAGADYFRSFGLYQHSGNTPVAFVEFDVKDDDLAENAEAVGVVLFSLTGNAQFEGELNHNDVLVNYFVINDDE